MIKTNIFGEEFVSKSKATLISNEKGDYFMYSDNYTKYQGYCFNQNMEIYKCIDRILLKNSKVLDIYFSPSYIEVLTDKGKQTFYLNDEGLLYENHSEIESEFILDFRKLFDMSSFGRYYEINREKDFIIIKFNKKKDQLEPNNQEYEMFMAIKSEDLTISNIKNWISTNYEFDLLRNDVSKRYAYSAFSSKAKRFAISSSTDKELAVKKAIKLFESSNSEKKFEVKKTKAPKEVNYAYNLSINALSNLSKKNLNGIYAGMPWFMQFWTRDSGLSLKSLSGINKEFARGLLYKYARSVRGDGLIPNRLPHSELDSIDSTGIIFFRIKENLNLFTKQELKDIFEILKKSIDSIEINHFNNFVLGKKYETWMDTQEREGERIEIQSLFLSMISLARELSAFFSDPILSKFYLNKEKEFLEKVKKSFFIDGNLLDGNGDKTIRPNVFLAYYFYPKLLLNKEWEKVFSHALNALFLDWGGLSTIDNKDLRFTQVHTGMNNLSYHNGDSWYFINNLSAICMQRLNKNKFKKYIDKILNTSTDEILNSGIFGYHSEISSAKFQESNGCLAQTWSSAFYIELIDEMFS